MPVLPLVDGGGISTYYISTTDEASADTLLMATWSQQAPACKPCLMAMAPNFRGRVPTCVHMCMSVSVCARARAGVGAGAGA